MIKSGEREKEKISNMKRFIAVLSGLLVLPAFAEVAPIFYEDVIEYAEDEFAEPDIVLDEMTDDVQSVGAPTVVAPASTKSAATPRSAATVRTSRAAPATTNSAVTSRSTPSRAVSARSATATTASRGTSATGTQSRAAVSRGTVSRAAVTAGNTNFKTTAPTQTVTARTSAPATSGSTTARAGLTQTDTVNTPLYTGRVGVRTNASARVPTIRVATATSSAATTTSTSTPTPADMDQLAELTEYCRAQYTSCMDNFCNVLDDNQGRCSCSANLKNYAKTEDALKQATEDLQDVAQKIQYIGLTSDEVETLFKQTEAELAMQQNSDNTQLKNDLDRIKNMIVDVKAGTTTTTDTGMSLDLSGLLDFSFSSTGFDLASLFGGNNNTTSISNQRGADLYKTATARCKASVLNSCTAQGVDASVVTNAYDLEIDKQCIAYERSLTDTNTQMTQTVRNAKSVLQKARLLVAQQKNAYDLRGCINALDSCMQDDFVCGSDYENCLDPTGKYIVNGKIVVGSVPGDAAVPSDADMANFLRPKIGKLDSRGRASGMCGKVMLKCQNSVKKNDKYDADNPLVTEYLARTIPRIRALRAKMLSDYGATCATDVISCVNQNGYEQSRDAAARACAAVIRTCLSLIDDDGGDSFDDIRNWLTSILGTPPTSDSDTNQWPGVPGFPDANVEKTPTDAELSLWQRQDIDACLSIGNTKISKSGAFCVMYGKDVNETEDELQKRAQQAVSRYGGVINFSLSRRRGYSETIKKVPTVNVQMYMMRFAYYIAKTGCKEMGGEYPTSLGGRNSWPKCTGISVSDAEQCKTLHLKTLVGLNPIPHSLGPLTVSYNYNKNTGMCNVGLMGGFYTAADIPGTCQNGFEPDPKDPTECIATYCLTGDLPEHSSPTVCMTVDEIPARSSNF